MIPSICPGDIILYHPIEYWNSPIKEGSIVLIKHPLEETTTLIKRVINFEESGIRVEGDNQDNSVDSKNFGLISKYNVVGIAYRKISKQRLFLFNLSNKP